MPTRIYHREVYAPEVFFRSPGWMRLRYTRHAEIAAGEDQYGDFSRHLSPYKDFDEGEIVEVELDDQGEICKRVVRFQVCERFVLVMAIGADGVVRTVWANRIGDRHDTLKKGLYVQKPCVAMLSPAMA